jgi:hypothetical protein
VFSKGTVLSPIKGKKEIYYWRGYYGNSAEVDISVGGEVLRLEGAIAAKRARAALCRFLSHFETPLRFCKHTLSCERLSVSTELSLNRIAL